MTTAKLKHFVLLLIACPFICHARLTDSAPSGRRSSEDVKAGQSTTAAEPFDSIYIECAGLARLMRKSPMEKRVFFLQRWSDCVKRGGEARGEVGSLNNSRPDDRPVETAEAALAQ